MRCWVAVASLVALSFSALAVDWSLPEVKATRVQRRWFHSTVAKADVSFHIYTPEVYDADAVRRFPVLYWLHGTGGGSRGIAPLSMYFDRAIREKKIPPMIVVFPNGMATSMWCDSKDGSVPMETVVVKELVPHVDSTWRTIARREGRLIEGFSMGGYGAARFGLKHPDVFAHVSILAGGPLDLEFQGPRATANPDEHDRILREVFGGDLNYFKSQSPWMLAEQNAKSVLEHAPHIRIAVGLRDNTGPLNRMLSARFDQLGIPHAFTVLPEAGHNTMALLNAMGEKNWAFYREAFGALETPPATEH